MEDVKQGMTTTRPMRWVLKFDSRTPVAKEVVTYFCVSESNIGLQRVEILHLLAPGRIVPVSQDRFGDRAFLDIN